MSQGNLCTEGDVRVIGLTTENAIAGHVELCYSNEWRAVCAGGWDMSAAEVVCRQMLALAPESGTIKTKYTVYMPKLCNIYNLQQKFWFKCAQTRVLAKAF